MRPSRTAAREKDTRPRKKLVRPPTGDGNHAHHPAGKSPFHAMGEETIRVAAGALAGHKDGRFFDTGGEQLPPVRFRKIQMHAGSDCAMPRSTRGEKEHGIFISDLVGIVYLAKEFGCVGKLRFEFLLHFFSDGITALPYARPDGGDEIFRTGAKFQPHTPHPVFHNARQSASPPCMKGRDRPLFAVGNENRDAIRRLDAQQDTRLVGHQAITLEQRGRLVLLHVFRLDSPDERGMDLAECDEAEEVLAFSHRADKELPICRDDLAVIGIGEAEIEIGFSGFSGPVDGCFAADSGAESMNEPGKVRMLLSCPVGYTKDLRCEASPSQQAVSIAKRAAVSLGRCHPRYIMSSWRGWASRD